MIAIRWMKLATWSLGSDCPDTISLSWFEFERSHYWLSLLMRGIQKEIRDQKLTTWLCCLMPRWLWIQPPSATQVRRAGISVRVDPAAAIVERVSRLESANRSSRVRRARFLISWIERNERGLPKTRHLRDRRSDHRPQVWPFPTFNSPGIQSFILLTLLRYLTQTIASLFANINYFFFNWSHFYIFQPTFVIARSCVAIRWCQFSLILISYISYGQIM